MPYSIETLNKKMTHGHQPDTHIPNQQLHLFSKHGRKPNPNNAAEVTWLVNPPIMIPEQCQALISVQCAQISHCFYSFTSSNSTFEYLNGTGSSSTVTLSPGNYSDAQIISAMNGLQNDFVISIPDPNTTHKFHMKSVNPQHTIAVVNDWGLLGFRDGQFCQGTTTTVAGRCYQLAGLSSLLIQSSFPVKNLSSYSMGSNESILARIPIMSMPGSTIYYQQSDSFNIPVNLHMINLISIKLTDHDHQLIDLELDWDLTLSLGVRKMPNRFQPLHLKHLKELHDKEEDDPEIENLSDLDKEEFKEEKPQNKNDK